MKIQYPSQLTLYLLWSNFRNLFVSVGYSKNTVYAESRRSFFSAAAAWQKNRRRRRSAAACTTGSYIYKFDILSCSMSFGGEGVDSLTLELVNNQNSKVTKLKVTNLILLARF